MRSALRHSSRAPTTAWVSRNGSRTHLRVLGTTTPTEARSSLTCNGFRRSVDSRPGVWASTAQVALGADPSRVGLVLGAGAGGLRDHPLGGRSVDGQPVAGELDAQEGRGRLRVGRRHGPRADRRQGRLLRAARRPGRPGPTPAGCRRRAASRACRRRGRGSRRHRTHVDAVDPVGVRRTVRCRPRAAPWKSKRSPRVAAGRPARSSRCAAAHATWGVASQPPARRRWASATSQQRATGTPAATSGGGVAAGRPPDPADVTGRLELGCPRRRASASRARRARQRCSRRRSRRDRPQR